MEIILDTDLKLILKNLNLEQKGTLFDLLLGEITTTSDEVVKNFYTYIENLSTAKQAKKAKMKSIGLLGSNARWKKSSANNIANTTTNSVANSITNTTANTTANNIDNTAVTTQKRKETKEKINLNNKNNIFLSPELSKTNSLHKYKIPTLSEVKEYIKSHSFNVDAETFVDFYESRGWCVGKSEIKNWQATVRMWHKRATQKILDADSLSAEDETYWHEQKQKYWTSSLTDPPLQLSNSSTPNFVATPQKDKIAYNTYSEISSPFTRFIKRIEENDLNKES